MRSAEARFSASTMMSSSIRLSLVGAQVDCTTKHITSPNVLLDLDGDLTIRKAADMGCTQ